MLIHTVVCLILFDRCDYAFVIRRLLEMLYATLTKSFNLAGKLSYPL